MTMLTIEIPVKAEKTFSDLVILLGGKIVNKGLTVNSDERNLTSDDIEAKNFREPNSQNKDISILNEDLDAIVFMKFGYHAEEKEDDIIKRKIKEFKDTGKMFWGYSGTICHPIKQVQPFLKDMHLQGKKVFLAMSFTKSKLKNESKQSSKFSNNNSIDAIWEKIPDGILVKGSRYAIVCSQLMECNIKLNLNNYTIAKGSSANIPASKYIKNRIDKACLIKTNSEQLSPNEIKISLLAEIIEPYAVFMSKD